MKCVGKYIYTSHACESRIFCLYTVKYIGESSNGRTADFDSVSLGSNPSSPKQIQTGLILRDRETVSRWAHNPKTGGSTPSPATKKIYSRFDIIMLIGSSLAGRASDSESGGPRFES